MRSAGTRIGTGRSSARRAACSRFAARSGCAFRCGCPGPMREEDVEALLASLTTMRDLAIVLLMLDGGLRPGEVLCLQLGDVAYRRRRVTVRKRDDHPRGARSKARHEQVVDLHEPRTLDAVKRYVLRMRCAGW